MAADRNAPFFIVGAGRSGTTLLRLILAGHSRLCIPPETWFLRDLVEHLPLHRELDPGQVDRAVQIITEHCHWPDMEIEADAMCQWAAALVRPTLADIVDLVYRHHLAQSGKPRFGDKTPHYFLIAPQLAELYPQARFIHLVRDGHDVAMSWIDLDWDRYYEPGFEWTTMMRTLQVYRTSVLWDRFHEVRYEDLVTAPEPTVRGICSFLGEAFEPSMLDWQNRRALVPARERHIHPKLGQRLDAEARSTWRSRLTAIECFAMEACLHRELRQLGYRVRFAAGAWRPALDVTGWLLRRSAPLLGRVSRHLRRRGLLQRLRYL